MQGYGQYLNTGIELEKLNEHDCDFLKGIYVSNTGHWRYEGHRMSDQTTPEEITAFAFLRDNGFIKVIQGYSWVYGPTELDDLIVLTFKGLWTAFVLFKTGNETKEQFMKRKYGKNETP